MKCERIRKGMVVTTPNGGTGEVISFEKPSGNSHSRQRRVKKAAHTRTARVRLESGDIVKLRINNLTEVIGDKE